MKQIISDTKYVLATALRGLLYVYGGLAAPPVVVAILADGFLRLRFRNATASQAFLSPILSWEGFKPFFIACVIVGLLLFGAPAFINDFGWRDIFGLWIIAAIGCLGFFWFTRNIGSGSNSIQTPGDPQHLEAAIKGTIFGQDKNIESITGLLIDRLAAPRERGPVATFMLAGPTGTGKTETARLVAQHLGLPIFIVRCNEYTNKWTSDRLIGAQGAYKNAENGGELTNALMASPRGVLVLDEIEKADGSIAKILMTLLDEGCITSAFDGQVVDARGWIMFATTNAAHEAIANVSESITDTIALRIGIKDALRDHWPPEILGRLDRVLAFRRVTNQEDVARQLVSKALTSVFSRLDRVVGTITPEAGEFMLSATERVGKYGFRELERYFEEVASMGLAGRQHARRRNAIKLEFYVENEDLKSRVID